MSNSFKIEKNLDLLSILRYESSARAIAKKLGCSHVAVSKRIRKLREHGYIYILLISFLMVSGILYVWASR